MINKKEYISENNRVEFFGTDELEDPRCFLKCWSKEETHAGVYEWVQDYFDVIRSTLDISKVIEVRGHSLGAARGIEFAKQLLSIGAKVDLNVTAPFPIYTKTAELPDPSEFDDCIIYEYGSDPITGIIPWFKHIVPVTHRGPKRNFFKCIFELIRIWHKKSHHNSYV